MFENCRAGVNSDHTPMDAMVNVVMSHFIDLGINDFYEPESQSSESEEYFTYLDWKLDNGLLDSINEAKADSMSLCKNLVLKREAFTGFGKTAITNVKANPDTFVQMAIQLAYMRLHKKPGKP